MKKDKKSYSFNLTRLGRVILAEICTLFNQSQGNVVEMLIKQNIVVDLSEAKMRNKTTLRGRISLFSNKNRGITTAVYVTPEAREMGDTNAKLCGVSRGDYIEYLMREWYKKFECPIEEIVRELEKV